MVFRSLAGGLLGSPAQRTLLWTFSRQMGTYQELTIPVPWGHIAGRASGPEDGEPLLMLHGLMDNCGSFDGIQLRLPSRYRCVSIDLPGHGWSSHLPAGIMYDYFKGVTYIALVRQHLGWDQLSLLGHSMGAGIGLLYAGCFPNQVRRMVALDPVMLLTSEQRQPDVTRESVQEFLKVLQRQRKGPSDGVDYAELRRRVMSHGQLPAAAADVLLRRGGRRVDADAGRDAADRHRLTADPLHRVTALLQPSAPAQYAAYLSRLRCRLLTVLAEGSDRWGMMRHEAAVLDACRRALGQAFTLVTVPGQHHVHLTHPDRVAPHVVGFLEEEMGDAAGERSVASDRP